MTRSVSRKGTRFDIHPHALLMRDATDASQHALAMHAPAIHLEVEPNHRRPVEMPSQAVAQRAAAAELALEHRIGVMNCAISGRSAVALGLNAGMRPWVGLMVAIPLQCAGQRKEPPMSLP